MMPVRVLEDRAPVYAQADTMSTVVAELHSGDEFSIGPAAITTGVTWCSAMLPNGIAGYVLGNIKIYRIRPVALLQPAVEVLTEPSAGSPLLTRYMRGQRFVVAGLKKQNGVTWVEVRTPEGGVGYIPADTRIAEGHTPDAAKSVAKELAKKNLMRGFLWLAAGILVTVVTYTIAASNPNGGHYYIAWGAIAFGGFRFFKGVMDYVQAKG